jgi:MFS family permease
VGAVRRALVGLYPREWRRRYGDELLELLAMTSLTIPTVIDTLRGAVDAHLHLDEILRSPRSAEMWTRSACSALMVGWVMLGLAASGVAKSTEGPAFSAAAHAHPLMAVSRLLAIAGFATATAALAAAGAGVVGMAVRQFSRRRDRRGGTLLMVPFACVALVLAAGVGAGALAAGSVRGSRNLALLAALLLVILVCAVASVAAGVAVVERTELPGWLLRGLGWVLPVATGAMALAFVSGCAYGLAVWVDEPGLFRSDNGIVATYLPLNWVVLLLLAGLAVAVPTRSTVRHLRVAIRRGVEEPRA